MQTPISSLVPVLTSKVFVKIKITGVHLPDDFHIHAYPNETVDNLFQRVNQHVGYRFGRFEMKSFKIGTYHQPLNYGESFLDLPGDERSGLFFKSTRPLLEALAFNFVNWSKIPNSKWFRVEHCFARHTLTVEPNYETLILSTQFKTMTRNLTFKKNWIEIFKI